MSYQLIMQILNDVLDTPWKFWNEVNRLLFLPWIKLIFRLNGIQWKKRWRIYGIPVIQKHRRSTITFESGLGLRSSLRSNPLGPNRPVIICTWKAGAVLTVGEDFAMTGGTLCAANRITIGNRVAIGANSIVIDTDFHPLNFEKRIVKPEEGKTAPISIEDDVFVGMNCLILKGATIRKGSVIGAGSVVTGEVPEMSIAAGNPARVLKAVLDE